MDRLTMPFQKGKKFWIEIQAKEDGDLVDQKNVDIFSLLYKEKQIGQFDITQLIFRESYFNEDLSDRIIDFINSLNK